MSIRTLHTRILTSFSLVILAFGLSVAVFGYYAIKHNIIERAQGQARSNLRIAHAVYRGQIESMEKAFGLISSCAESAPLMQALGLDYLYRLDKEEAANAKSGIIRRCLFEAAGTGGTRIIEKEELEAISADLAGLSRIEIKATARARPSQRKALEDAMAIEYAAPLLAADGSLEGVLCGGKIINRNFAFIDKIHDLVFEEKLYAAKPLGTVTIFLDDVRIATNVLDREGNRAIGTRVSERVYHNVVEEGRSWVDRAFVVTDWYLTAYEPIRDIDGKVIGILYVGILEKPFNDMRRNFFLAFLALIVAVVLLATVLSYVLATGISRPLKEMLGLVGEISSGRLDSRVRSSVPIKELNTLAESFNEMARRLQEHDRSLKVFNEKLSALNKSYLDLIGFVAHELKGILSSTILNAYSVRDGFLGMINFKQRKALDSVTRNLDYLAATVKKFLNLSRIEKGELELNRSAILIREDVFDVSVDGFLKYATEKGMRIKNNIEPGVRVLADLDLLQMVANNLVGNAVKYGSAGGEVVLSSKASGSLIQVEVYSDGEPISAADTEKLFKRFSRIDSPAKKRVQGTGLGLFIAKEIVERHAGKIWFEPREHGNAFIFSIEKGV